MAAVVVVVVVVAVELTLQATNDCWLHRWNDKSPRSGSRGGVWLVGLDSPRPALDNSAFWRFRVLTGRGRGCGGRRPISAGRCQSNSTFYVSAFYPRSISDWLEWRTGFHVWLFHVLSSLPRPGCHLSAWLDQANGQRIPRFTWADADSHSNSTFYPPALPPWPFHSR